MELLVKEGVVHSLQRGDTVVVALGGPVSTQGRMLLQRQLRALFPAQKVVVLDQGMTFQVYREHHGRTEVRQPPEPTVLEAEDPQNPPARRRS